MRAPPGGLLVAAAGELLAGNQWSTAAPCTPCVHTRLLPHSPPPSCSSSPCRYKIDYVRVWQSESNVGCSPPDFPTAQYLACKRDTYVNTEADQALIPGVCDKLPSCRSEWGYERQGGELYSGKDIRYEVTNVTTPQECCQICAQEKQCGAYK